MVQKRIKDSLENFSQKSIGMGIVFGVGLGFALKSILLGIMFGILFMVGHQKQGKKKRKN